jgi:hypothetical protein
MEAAAMPDLKVALYCFANDRVWQHNRRSRFWGEVAYQLWKRLSIAQQHKVADRYSPF